MSRTIYETGSATLNKSFIKTEPSRFAKQISDLRIWSFSKELAAMEELRSAMEDHFEQMGDLLQKFSAELRSGLQPAYENFIGFFHAIDWKVQLYLALCLVREKVRLQDLWICAVFVYLNAWPFVWIFAGTLANGFAGIPFCVAVNNLYFQEEPQFPNVFVPFGM